MSLRSALNSIWESIVDYCAQAVEIWLAGGWAMAAIAVVALIMFGLGTHIFIKLWATGFRFVPERTWRKWIDNPRQRHGRIGEMLNFVAGEPTLAHTKTAFAELRATEIAPFERDLKVMKICVGAAPLLGLLGTVIGMLTTFGALSSGSGGDKTMSMVASGISEALITTATGLVVALPGLLFQSILARTFERYKAFLAHLETVCTQHQFRQLRKEQKAAA